MNYDDIHTLLVADQGIGALQAIRATRDLGVRAVAVYAKPHEHSLHVKLADSAVCIGDDICAYSNARHIIQAAKSSYATIIVIYDGGEFYFSRLSVGANVDQTLTEQVTVVDMTREQISVALGSSLSFRQKKIRLRGSAIATRVTASSTASSSAVDRWRAAAGQGVRV